MAGISIKALERLVEFDEELAELQHWIESEMQELRGLVDAFSARVYEDCENEQRDLDYEDMESEEKELRRFHWLEYANTIDGQSSSIYGNLTGLAQQQRESITYARKILSTSIEQARRYYGATVTVDAVAIKKSGGDHETRKPGKYNKNLDSEKWGSLPPLPKNMIWVEVSEIDLSDVDDSLAFKKVSRDRIQRMMRSFENNVLPLMRTSEFNVNKLRYQFEESGSVDSNSPVLAYQCMIDNDDDTIAVSKTRAGGYSLTNGRHRALVAIELGWKFVPVRLV